MSESGSVRTSLRQKPRVRYDTLGSFEGVDLGDDDELRRLRPLSSSDEDAGPDPEGAASGSAAKKKGKGKQRAATGRAASASKRSAKGRSREASSESEFELDEEADDAGHDDDYDHGIAEEDSGGEGRDDDFHDDDVLDFSQGKSAKKGGKKKGRSGLSGGAAGPGAEYNSDEDAFLAAQYSTKNKLVDAKKDASGPNVTQFGGTIAKVFKQGNWQVLVENTIPLHPTGQTFLLSPPDLGKFSNIWVVDTEENPRGQGLTEAQRAGVLHGHWTRVPLETPWNWWMGQAWWPDCYQTYEDAGDGTNQRKRRKIDWHTEKPKDLWKQKVEVNLGLEDVGRYKVRDVEHMTIAQAREYLPLREHNPEPTLIIGVRTEEDEGADVDPPEAYKFQALQAMQFRGGSMRQCQVFDAGQYVSGVDWCPMSEEDSAKRGFRQYLAVSTMTPSPVNEISNPVLRTRGCIQIWSLAPRSDEERDLAKAQMSEEVLEDYDEGYDADMVCEMVVCIEGSEVRELKWLPFSCCDEALNTDHSVGDKYAPKIGIVSALLCSGELAFYAIPDPEVIRSTKPAEPENYLPFTSFIQLEPLLVLQLNDAVGLTMDWASADRVAVGYNDGTIAVWDDVTTLLRESSRTDGARRDVPPSHYIHAHPAAITTLTWAKLPVADTEGNLLLDQPTPYLLSGSVDPNIIMHDLRDMSGQVFIDKYIRFTSTTAWHGMLDFPITQDSEHILHFVRLRQISTYSFHRLFAQQGPIRTIACSDYHGMIAAGGVDGCVTWMNAARASTRARKARVAQQTLFRLDYSRVSGLYRMTDGFAPDVPNHAARIYSQPIDAPKPKKPLTAEDWRSVSAGFPLEVNITKTAWHNGGGLGRAAMLASGSGSGICRIDFMKGFLYRAYRQSLAEDLGLCAKTEKLERMTDPKDEEMAAPPNGDMD